MDKIKIPLSNGFNLIAERNTGEFDHELFVGLEDPTGRYYQDLVIVRPTYRLAGDKVLFDADKFEMLIFGDAQQDDFTDKVTVPLAKEEE